MFITLSIGFYKIKKYIFNDKNENVITFIAR